MMWLVWSVIVYLVLGVLIGDGAYWNERRLGRNPGRGAYFWIAFLWPVMLAVALWTIAKRRAQ